VAGLRSPPSNAGAPVGTIQFPTFDPGTGVELREDFVDAQMGMPADLNGDGTIDDADHSGDYRFLPVRVRVQWYGALGTRTLTVETVLWNR
jgi:hypothetical protein